MSFGAFGGMDNKGKAPAHTNPASTSQSSTTTAAPIANPSTTTLGQNTGLFGSQSFPIAGSSGSTLGTSSSAPSSSSGFTGASIFGNSTFPSSSTTTTGSGLGLGTSASGTSTSALAAPSTAGQGSLFQAAPLNHASSAPATTNTIAGSTPSFNLGAPTSTFGAPSTSTATSAAGSTPSLNLGTSSTAPTNTFLTSATTPAATTAPFSTSMTGSSSVFSLTTSAPTTSASTTTFGALSTAPAATTGIGSTTTSATTTTTSGTGSMLAPGPLDNSSGTSTLTTRPNSGLASASAAPTRETIPTSTINAIITRLNSETLESILNKWTQDLNIATREFHRQAVDVAHWDKALLDNGQLISQLYSETLEAEYSQKLIDQNLEYIELQQTGLAKTLDEYEQFINQAYNSVQSQHAHVKATDDEREQMYSLAEGVGQRLDHVNEQLTSVVNEINELAGLDSSSPMGNGVSGSVGSSATMDPFSQVVQILNAHLTTLKWLDQNCDTLQTQIQTLETRAASSQMEVPSTRSVSDLVAPPLVQRNLVSRTQPLSPHPPRAFLSSTTAATTGITPTGAQTPLSAYAQRYGSNLANQPQGAAGQATPTAGGNLTASPLNTGMGFRSHVASQTGMPQSALFSSNQNTSQLQTASPSPATNSFWRR
ncbi:FG-nucleoporin nsp1 [Dispira simplex]|nr:FG-nucleoporin nsp1 [Dispira simplex]